RFHLMWQDALKAADPEVDFHAYDTDESNRLSYDEMAVMIIRPQATAYGTNREVQVALDGNSNALTVDLLDLYLSESSGDRRNGVGLLAHEMSHPFLGARDLYGC